MTYSGEVRRGVVVLEDAPPLLDGTRVRVEVEAATEKPRRGSIEAVRQIPPIWEHISEEIDLQLAELHRVKQDELKAQLAKPDPEL